MRCPKYELIDLEVHTKQVLDQCAYAQSSSRGARAVDCAGEATASPRVGFVVCEEERTRAASQGERGVGFHCHRGVQDLKVADVRAPMPTSTSRLAPRTRHAESEGKRRIARGVVTIIVASLSADGPVSGVIAMFLSPGDNQ